MIKWTEFSTSSKHLIVLTPAFFLWMFINSGIYQPIHNSCLTLEDNSTITYFESLQYLQSVAFTVGYGHISPACHSGKVYTFIFAYVTLPLVFYILYLLGTKIHRLVLNLESIVLKSSSLVRRLITILALDLLILIVFMIIPAGIVHRIEPCMDFGTSFWYLFATITTIGFGDVIAGTENIDCSDEMESMEYDFYHQNNLFWASKMGYLVIALSFMIADLILKHETVVEFFYSPAEKMFGKKHLIDNEISVDTVEVIDMNSTIATNPFDS